MTDNLPTTLTDEEINALANRAGAEKTAGNFTPQLKINYEEDSEDEDAPKLKGRMFVTGRDNPIYFKTATFRPLTHHYQYVQYDAAAEKVTNRSRLISSWQDEARDEKGTLKCGKPNSKELKANPALAKKYEDITTWTQVQGVISYTGIDKEGNEHTVENEVVCFRGKGANFSPFDEEYKNKIGSGRIWDHEVILRTERGKPDPNSKNKAAVFYVMRWEADFNNRKALTRDLYETAVGLTDRVEEINKAIDMKYYAALAGKLEDDKAIDALDISPSRPGANRPGQSLADDFNDSDIPF